MKKVLLFGFVFFLIFISSNFVFGIYCSGGNISFNLTTETESFVANVSQGGLTLNSTSYFYPTGKYLTGNIVLLLGSLESSSIDYFEPQIVNISSPVVVMKDIENASFYADVIEDNEIFEQGVNITFPNFTSIKNDTIYPFYFTPDLEGRHGVLFYAKDTGTNDNFYNTSFYVAPAINFTIPFFTHDSTFLNATFDYLGRNAYIKYNESIINDTVADVNYNLTLGTFSNRIKGTINNFAFSTINSFSLYSDYLEDVFNFEEIYVFGINNSIPIIINMTYSNPSEENSYRPYYCNNWFYANQSCGSTWALVPNYYKDTQNNLFTFNVSSITATYAFGIKSEEYCGDGFCSGDDTCENCPKDCGICVVDDDTSTDPSSDYTTGDSPIKKDKDDKEKNDELFRIYSADERNGIDISLSNENIALESIDLELNSVVTNVEMVISNLKDEELSSYHIPKIDKLNKSFLVYKYVLISHKNIENQNIKKARFKFLLKKNWIKQNNLTKNDIRVFKFLNSTWKEQKRKIESSSDDYYRIVSESQGLSLYGLAVFKEKGKVMVVPMDKYVEDVKKYVESEEGEVREFKEAFSFMFFLMVLGGFLGIFVFVSGGVAVREISFRMKEKEIRKDISEYEMKIWNDPRKMKNYLINKDYQPHIIKKALKRYRRSQLFLLSRYNLNKPHSNPEKLMKSMQKIVKKESLPMPRVVRLLKIHGWNQKVIDTAASLSGTLGLSYVSEKEVNDRFKTELKYINDYITKVRSYGFSNDEIKESLLKKKLDPKLVERIMDELHYKKKSDED